MISCDIIRSSQSAYNLWAWITYYRGSENHKNSKSDSNNDNSRILNNSGSSNCISKEAINSKNYSKTRCKISINSWAKIPTINTINSKFILIADEAHAMQSLLSSRTKNILLLCQNKNCYGVILSTGTPMKNGRPSNILPLLIGINHPVSWNKLQFEKKYCDGKKTYQASVFFLLL